MDLHEIFREGWQWASEQPVKFWWRSRSPSEYSDCFPDSSLLADTEVVSADCTAWPCNGGHALAGVAIATMTSLRHRPLAEVCTVPVLLVVIVIVIWNKCRSLLRWEKASKNVIHYDWVMAKTTILFHSIPGCTGPPTNISGYNLSRLLLWARAFLAPKQQCQSTERTSTVT